MPESVKKDRYLRLIVCWTVANLLLPYFLGAFHIFTTRTPLYALVLCFLALQAINLIYVRAHPRVSLATIVLNAASFVLLGYFSFVLAIYPACRLLFG
ncbi:hypothetical protein TM49_04845 [Martelella endophytica]|uniref:Uncharacterized protein n=1 Tax=Martelella endophytica TaxID=1486262 RepID=A0A0D5LPC4_MAREN|nr:hypothetical protein TM49_04845 [Martelella endophytica]